jgi:hypothetical protein
VASFLIAAQFGAGREVAYTGFPTQGALAVKRTAVGAGETDVSGVVLTEDGLVAGEAVLTDEGTAAHRLVATNEGAVADVAVAVPKVEEKEPTTEEGQA